MECDIHIGFDESGDDVVAFCDELNAVASGSTREEAAQNLRLAIEEMMKDYGPDFRERLRGRIQSMVEVA